MMPADSGEVEDTSTKIISSKLCDITDHRVSNDFSNICVPNQRPVVEHDSYLCHATANEINFNQVEPGASCDKTTSSNGSNHLKSTPNIICFDSKVFGGKYTKKSLEEVETFSVEDLKLLIRDLSKAVEEISSQLVELLVENDALQQESDARNVAIEQLLRITVKETENELKPVQMSVILTFENV